MAKNNAKTVQNHAHKSLLDEKRLALALGTGTAVGVGLMSLSLTSLRVMILGGWGMNSGMMNDAVGWTFLSVLAAVVWGFVVGGLTGYLTAWVYNRS